MKITPFLILILILLMGFEGSNIHLEKTYPGGKWSLWVRKVVEEKGEKKMERIKMEIERRGEKFWVWGEKGNWDKGFITLKEGSLKIWDNLRLVSEEFSFQEGGRYITFPSRTLLKTRDWIIQAGEGLIDLDEKILYLKKGVVCKLEKD